MKFEIYSGSEVISQNVHTVSETTNRKQMNRSKIVYILNYISQTNLPVLCIVQKLSKTPHLEFNLSALVGVGRMKQKFIFMNFI